MTDRFLIGDFPFRLTAPGDLPVPDNFLKFRSDVSPAYAYRLDWADELPALDIARAEEADDDMPI